MSKVRQIARKAAPAATPAAEAPVAAPEAGTGMSRQIALNNVVAVVRAYVCNADQRDILNESLQVIATGLNQTDVALARIEALEAEVAELTPEANPDSESTDA